MIPGFGLLGRSVRPALPRAMGDCRRRRAVGAAAGRRGPGTPVPGVRGRGAVRASCSSEPGRVRRSWPPPAVSCSGRSPTGAVPASEPYASTALRTIPPRENGGNLDRSAGEDREPRATPGACARGAAFARRRPLRSGGGRELRDRDRGGRDGDRAGRRAPVGAVAVDAAIPCFRVHRAAAAGGQSLVCHDGHPDRRRRREPPTRPAVAARRALEELVSWLCTSAG